MLNRVRKQIEQFHMLEKGDRVLMGISGGADSICMADILCQLRTEYELTLGAVYCHHGIRGEEADEDGEYAKRFCEENGISFYRVYEKVEDRAQKEKISVEEAGREFRYETFASLMEEEGFSKVSVAHNANDRAETMLFHLARGTNLAGLCTMEPIRTFENDKMLIRPLLWVSRDEIENWLKDRKIGWRTDSTNLLDVYTRNQIRHQVLPGLVKINNQAVLHMGEASDGLKEAHDYLQQEEERLYEKCSKWCANKKERTVFLANLKKEHVYMKKAVLYRALSDVTGSRKDITAKHVRMALELMEGSTGKEIHFGKKVRARKEYDKLIFFQEEESEQNKESLFGKISLKLERIQYTGQEISKNKYTKYFDCDKINDNVVLRNWKEGDYLYLREDGGRKKLSRYFIDEKIPANLRGEIPLLADGDHVMWVVGHRISAYYKVTDQTREILVATIQNKG